MNIEPGILQSHCSIDKSWEKFLYNPYENSINPCFLSFFNGCFNAIFAIPILYKIIQLLYYNSYGLNSIKYSFGSTFNLRSVGIYNIVKYNAIFIQIILSLVLLSFNSKSFNDVKFLSLLVQNLVLIMLVLPLQLIEPTRNIIASSPLLFYWVLTPVIYFVIVIQDFFSPYKIYIPKTDIAIQSVVHVVEVFLFINSLCIYILQTYFYKLSVELIDYYNLNDWDITSVRNVYERFYFLYMRKSIKIAKETNTIDINDLPSFTPDIQNANAYKLFLHYWDKSVAKAAAQTKELRLKDKNAKAVKPSLFRPLVYMTKWYFLGCTIFDILEFCTQISQPFLLRKFLIFATDRVQNVGDEPKQPIIVGIVLATLIYICSVGRYTSFNRYFYNTQCLGDTISTALSSHVYQKGMKLSPKERKDKSVGELVNNMAQDVDTLSEAPTVITTIVLQPVRLFFYMVTLYQFLGIGALAGLGAAVILIPLASACFVFVIKLQGSLMKHKDARSKLMSEILNSIKSIKLYSWENPMLERLKSIRNGKELLVLRNLGILSAFINGIWDSIPFAVAVASFICSGVFGNTVLTPDVIFPAITIFDLLTEPIIVLPSILSRISESKVAIDRLINLFVMEELEVEGLERTYRPLKKGEEAVTLKNASFLWTKEEPKEIKPPVDEENDIENSQPKEEINPVALTDINYVAKKGELSCLVGRVGTGKSTLLKAILGTMLVDYKPETVLKVNGSIAYCAQNAWILNATVRDNILFGRKYNKAFYEETIAACELTKDFEVLPDGDRTVVGEKGISLSGGQKARISLARAVYSKAEIYILDDILSAVDTHVGKNITKNVLGKSGLLASKTVILATNSVLVLHEADNICLLNGGKIVETGTFDQVMSTGSDLANLIKEFGKKSEEQELEEAKIEEEEENAKKLQKQASEIKEQTKDANSDDDDLKPFMPEGESNNTLTRIETNHTAAPSFVSYGHIYEDDFDDSDLVKKTGDTDEIQSKGKVDLRIYFTYLKACGYGWISFYVLLSTGGIFVTIINSFILKHWSEENAKYGRNVDVAFYLVAYAGVGVAGVLLSVLASIIIRAYVILRGSKHFHDTMAAALFRSPMSFFETTPIGRILNRFTEDISVIDSQLIWAITLFVTFVFRAVGVFGIVIYNLPIMFVVLGVLLWFYDYFRRQFIPASRELKRLRSANKSPVFSHLQESVTGVDTIWAYGQFDRFNHKFSHNLDNLVKTDQSNLGVNRWLSMRLQGLSAVIVFCCTLLIVSTFTTANPLTPGLTGFIMTYVLDVTGTLNAIVRSYADLETRSITIERIVEYCNLKPEAEMSIETTKPEESWPQHGAISFKKYETKYRENLDPVLRDIDIDIKPGEKIGIVGRTGAGKSTLTLALFRIIEASKGHIEIDGVDTSKIGLFDLRSKLNIIPQDSQAFDGTVRENLDPFGKHTDEELWKVLELSHLKEHIESMKTEKKEDDEANDTKKDTKKDTTPEIVSGLEARITEGGSNLSAGQKQLLCLARALLNPSKVLILDEATASVDVQTDKIVQDTIRTKFNQKTILTIAHRIETILDSDRILVLERGAVKEFAPPGELLKDTSSIFYSLCKEGGHLPKE